MESEIIDTLNPPPPPTNGQKVFGHSVNDQFYPEQNNYYVTNVNYNQQQEQAVYYQESYFYIEIKQIFNRFQYDY